MIFLFLKMILIFLIEFIIKEIEVQLLIILKKENINNNLIIDDIYKKN